MKQSAKLFQILALQRTANHRDGVWSLCVKNIDGIEMKYLKIITLILSALIIAGCASSKVSQLPIASVASHSVRAIAMAPEGGLLAEAVGIELSNLGYTIIDSSSTSKLMIRLNIDEIEIATPQGLEKLKSKGIDAYLTIKGVGSYDNQIESASARASSTHTGRIIAGVNWQNGWGCAQGSPCDRVMRKGLAEAAQEIASSLTVSLPRN